MTRDRKTQHSRSYGRGRTPWKQPKRREIHLKVLKIRRFRHLQLQVHQMWVYFFKTILDLFVFHFFWSSLIHIWSAFKWNSSHHMQHVMTSYNGFQPPFRMVDVTHRSSWSGENPPAVWKEVTIVSVHVLWINLYIFYVLSSPLLRHTFPAGANGSTVFEQWKAASSAGCLCALASCPSPRWARDWPLWHPQPDFKGREGLEEAGGWWGRLGRTGGNRLLSQTWLHLFFAPSPPLPSPTSSSPQGQGLTTKEHDTGARSPSSQTHAESTVDSLFLSFLWSRSSSGRRKKKQKTKGVGP